MPKKHPKPKAANSRPKKPTKIIVKLPPKPKGARAATAPGRESKQTMAPAFVGNDISFPAPRIRSSAMGLTVSRFEFVDYVSITNNTYNSAAYAINPGNAALFPFMATMSRNYTSYRFKKLVFHYINKCKSSLDGSVTLATVNNPGYPIPTSDRSMMDIQGAVTGPLWTPKKVFGRIASNDLDAGVWKLIGYDTTYPGSSAFPSQDIGAFFVGLYSGEVAQKDIGAIYVEYEVELREPVVNSLVTNSAPLSLTSNGLTTVVDDPNSGLLSDLLPVGKFEYVGDALGGALLSSPWMTSTPVSVVVPTSRWGLFDTQSRQFGFLARNATNYSFISSAVASTVSGPSNLITFAQTTNSASPNGGTFPKISIHIPGVYSIEVSSLVSAVVGTYVSNNLYLGTKPTAFDSSSTPVAVPAGFGGTSSPSRYCANYVNPIVTINPVLIMSCTLWVVVPTSAVLPVTVEIPTSGSIVLTGLSPKLTFTCTVQPYQTFGGTGSPAPSDTDSKTTIDEEAVYRRIMDKLKQTQIEEAEESPSGSGPLSESGFTLLTDLLQRRKR